MSFGARAPMATRQFYRDPGLSGTGTNTGSHCFRFGPIVDPCVGEHAYPLDTGHGIAGRHPGDPTCNHDTVVACPRTMIHASGLDGREREDSGGNRGEPTGGQAVDSGYQVVVRALWVSAQQPGDSLSTAAHCEKLGSVDQMCWVTYAHDRGARLVLGAGGPNFTIPDPLFRHVVWVGGHQVLRRITPRPPSSSRLPFPPQQ